MATTGSELRSAAVADSASGLGARIMAVVDRHMAVLFNIPTAVFLFGLAAVPIALIIATSFTDWQLVTKPDADFVGLENYILPWTDERWLGAMWHSVLYAVASVFGQFVLGLFTALLFNRSFAGKSFYRSVWMMPMISMSVAISLVWILFFDNAYGVLNFALGGLGIEPIEWTTSPEWALWSLILVGIWHYTPFMTLIMLSGLQSLPRDPFEAARDRRRVALAGALARDPAAAQGPHHGSAHPALDLRDEGVRHHPRDHRRRPAVQQRDHERQHLPQRLRISVHGSGSGQGRDLLRRHRLRPARARAAEETVMVFLRRLLPARAYKIIEAALFHLLLLAIVVPFFFIFFYMFWNSVKPDYLFFEPETWIFEPLWSNYTEVWEYSDLVPNIINSLIISSSATLIGLACGVLSSYTIARYRLKKLSVAILLVRMVPFITALVPFWIVYRHLGLLNTHVGIILAHLVITLPIAVWIMMGFMEDIPRELEEAAWIDGASKTEAFLRIVLPLATPGMVATAILVFIFSWNNFAFALVLGGLRRQHRAGVGVQVRRSGGRGQRADDGRGDAGDHPGVHHRAADPEAARRGPHHGRGEGMSGTASRTAR